MEKLNRDQLNHQVEIYHLLQLRHRYHLEQLGHDPWVTDNQSTLERFFLKKGVYV